jgi:anti-sigma regulatory factor (Ser/Thr protein kinase)
VRRFVEQAAASIGADPDAVGELVVAVYEAAVNIALHGYQDGTGDIVIAVERQGNRLLVRLTDSAPPFDPTISPEPDITTPLGLRRFGGMGVQMMRVFCDELHYRRLSAGVNELTLAKNNAFPAQ